MLRNSLKSGLVRLSDSGCVCRRQWLDSAHGSASREGAEVLAQNAQEEASAAVEMTVRRVGALDNLQCLDDHLDAHLDASPSRCKPAWG